MSKNKKTINESSWVSTNSTSSTYTNKQKSKSVKHASKYDTPIPSKLFKTEILHRWSYSRKEKSHGLSKLISLNKPPPKHAVEFFSSIPAIARNAPKDFSPIKRNHLKVLPLQSCVVESMSSASESSQSKVKNWLAKTQDIEQDMIDYRVELLHHATNLLLSSQQCSCDNEVPINDDNSNKMLSNQFKSNTLQNIESDNNSINGSISPIAPVMTNHAIKENTIESSIADQMVNVNNKKKNTRRKRKRICMPRRFNTNQTIKQKPVNKLLQGKKLPRVKENELLGRVRKKCGYNLRGFPVNVSTHSCSKANNIEKPQVDLEPCIQFDKPIFLSSNESAEVCAENESPVNIKNNVMCSNNGNQKRKLSFYETAKIVSCDSSISENACSIETDNISHSYVCLDQVANLMAAANTDGISIVAETVSC